MYTVESEIVGNPVGATAELVLRAEPRYAFDPDSISHCFPGYRRVMSPTGRVPIQELGKDGSRKRRKAARERCIYGTRNAIFVDEVDECLRLRRVTRLGTKAGPRLSGGVIVPVEDTPRPQRVPPAGPRTKHEISFRPKPI